MNLEIKHLAPYLPYNIKVKYFDKTVVMNAGQGSSTHWIGITALLQRQNKENCLPKLRPLSDLTKEIDIDGKKFVPIDWLEDKYYTLDLHKQCLQLTNDTEEWIYQCDYMLVEHLFEWHFDVFGLIDEGLALPLI